MCAPSRSRSRLPREPLTEQSPSRPRLSLCSTCVWQTAGWLGRMWPGSTASAGHDHSCCAPVYRERPSEQAFPAALSAQLPHSLGLLRYIGWLLLSQKLFLCFLGSINPFIQEDVSPCQMCSCCLPPSIPGHVEASLSTLQLLSHRCLVIFISQVSNDNVQAKPDLQPTLECKGWLEYCHTHLLRSCFEHYRGVFEL